MTVKTTNGKYPLTRIELSDDFIGEHLNTFFLPEETEEVIEEENLDELLEKDKDTASGAVVALISGEVSYDDAVEILNMLLYSDKDFEERTANYNVLDDTVTAGIATDVIRLIPWTGFVMDATGVLPTKISTIDLIVDIIGGFVQFVVGVADVLVEGFLALAGFIGALVDIVVDWGLKLWNRIVDFFSDVKAAVSEVVEFLVALRKWVSDVIESYMRPVVDKGEDYYIEQLNNMINDLVTQFESLASDEISETALKKMVKEYLPRSNFMQEFFKAREKVMRFFNPYLYSLSRGGDIVKEIVGDFQYKIYQMMFDFEGEMSTMLRAFCQGNWGSEVEDAIEEYNLREMVRLDPDSFIDHMFVMLAPLMPDGITDTTSPSSPNEISWIDTNNIPQQSDSNDIYGMIIGGGGEDSQTFWGDVVDIHETFTEAGVPENRVTTLFADEQDGYEGIVDGPASKQNILEELEQVNNSMDNNDKLYIFISSHGVCNEEDRSQTGIPTSTVNLYWEELRDEINKNFGFGEKRYYSKMAITISACYAGDATEILSSNSEGVMSDNRIVMTASEDDFDEAAAFKGFQTFFMGHFMNRMQRDLKRAAIYGIFHGVFLSLILGIVGLTAGGTPALIAFFGTWLVFSIISMYGASIGKTSFGGSFVHARGWCEYGWLLWISKFPIAQPKPTPIMPAFSMDIEWKQLNSYPQIYNKELAKKLWLNNS